MIEPAPLAAKLTGSKEIRHAASPVKKTKRTSRRVASNAGEFQKNNVHKKGWEGWIRTKADYAVSSVSFGFLEMKSQEIIFFSTIELIRRSFRSTTLHRI